jgi:hypothetical protein
MYERMNGQTINDSTDEVLEELTLFVVNGILTRTDSKAVTRNFNVLNTKDGRKIDWDMDTTGTNIEIKNHTRQMKGRIVNGLLVDSVLFSNREVEFILLPIELGISIKPLKGRYMTIGLNNNYIIDFSDMIERGNYKGLQKTSFTWRIEDRSGTEHGLTKYSNSKYNNLVYVGGMNQFLQPVMKDAESAITFNAFPDQIDRPDTTLKSVIKLSRTE